MGENWTYDAARILLQSFALNNCGHHRTAVLVSRKLGYAKSRTGNHPELSTENGHLSEF